jgi:hypothetical protein
VPPSSRSAQSLRFEAALRAAAAGAVPRLTDVDFDSIADLMRWVAFLHPNREEYTLRFVRAGAGISQLLGREAVGFDYLDIVDHTIKGDAFDATFVMLSRPCGLWQITPGLAADGRTVDAEYTGFPVFDVENGRGLIAMLAHIPPPHAQIVVVQRSTAWEWLELKGGGAVH